MRTDIYEACPAIHMTPSQNPPLMASFLSPVPSFPPATAVIVDRDPLPQFPNRPMNSLYIKIIERLIFFQFPRRARDSRRIFDMDEHHRTRSTDCRRHRTLRRLVTRKSFRSGLPWRDRRSSGSAAHRPDDSSCGREAENPPLAADRTKLSYTQQW